MRTELSLALGTEIGGFCRRREDVAASFGVGGDRAGGARHQEVPLIWGSPFPVRGSLQGRAGVEASTFLTAVSGCPLGRQGGKGEREPPGPLCPHQC